MNEAEHSANPESAASDSSPSSAPLTMPSRPVPRQISSLELLGRERELLIVHRGRQYRLRVTQNEKLILTA